MVMTRKVTASEVTMELRYQRPILVWNKRERVGFKGEALGPKLDARAHHVLLRLEACDQRPIDREGPEDRHNNSHHSDDETNAVEPLDPVPVGRIGGRRADGLV